MYAIVEIGGRQHRVAQGDRLRVSGLPKGRGKEAEEGGQITISTVVAVGSGKRLQVGAPYVPNAKVVAQFEREVLGPKVTVFKFARRKKERTKIGHRQRYMDIWIKSIDVGGAQAQPAEDAGQPQAEQEKKGT